MGKKRTRETDAHGDVAMTDPAIDKKHEDESSDDEVRRHCSQKRIISMGLLTSSSGLARTWKLST